MSHPKDKQLLRSQNRTVLLADMLQIILEPAQQQQVTCILSVVAACMTHHGQLPVHAGSDPRTI
jgi:hypothetical protein